MGKNACAHMTRPAIFVVAAFLLLLGWPSGPAKAATLHNVHGWAWSGTTGWIAVNCEDEKPGYPGYPNPGTGDCSAGNGNYGLDIGNDKSVSGWAWSTNVGWICFGSTCDGLVAGGTPTDDHFCASHTPCAIYNPGDGQIHGWAYIIGSTDGSLHRGWISLNCSDVDPNSVGNCGASTYGVNFDEPTGYLHGYAWNGNSDDSGNGWLIFSCGWPRPCGGPDGDWGVYSGYITDGWTSIDQQEGVYSPAPAPATGIHLTSIPIVFRGFSAPADSTLRCHLRMSNGTIRQVDSAISSRIYDVDYTQSYDVQPGDELLDASGNLVPWSFSAVGPYGCEIIGVPLVQLTVSNLIAVHPSTWSFTGPAGPATSDSVRAKYCLDGQLGVSDPSRAYFLNNAAQCDVEGDLAYTLLKAKGVKVEVRCRDDIDDDANLLKDYAGTCNATIPISSSDRNCRGVTYLCITHPAPPPANPPLP